MSSEKSLIDQRTGGSVFVSTFFSAVSGSGSARSGVEVTEALRQASARTGVGFDYLLRTAERESGLRPEASASTSSAHGLFQFVEQTWLETLKEEGPRFGLDKLAAQIERGSSGVLTISDPATFSQVMGLREDPAIAALMAGALTARNAAVLESKLGRRSEAGDLYIAHVLGASGGARLIEAAEAMPEISAVDLFPRAAQANKSIFYHRDGSSRSAAQVHAMLSAGHEDIVHFVTDPSTDVARSSPVSRPRVNFSFVSLPDPGTGMDYPFAWMAQNVGLSDLRGPVDWWRLGQERYLAQDERKDGGVASVRTNRIAGFRA